MREHSERTTGRMRSSSPRRPSRALAILVTLVVVIAAAVALPMLLSPAGGPAEPYATPTGVVGASPSGPGATPRSSFPPPAVSPAVEPSAPSPSATPSLVPLSPSPIAVGTKATRIRIDRLDIDLPVIEGDGVDAPLFKAAHYPGTAWPRGGSNIYIYGHAQERMFLSLWNARVGDEVVLDLADGTEAAYLVAEVIPTARWNDLSLLDPTPVEQLTLQTSTSNTATAPRFVVIARPKS